MNEVRLDKKDHRTHCYYQSAYEVLPNNKKKYIANFRVKKETLVNSDERNIKVDNCKYNVNANLLAEAIRLVQLG